jgi:hypothetical protein
MSVIARRIASVPQRTSSATWQAITDLLAPAPGPARSILDAIAGPGAIVIAEEYTSGAPLVIVPASGSRIRIYTVHGPDALDALHDETGLMAYPLDAPGWSISLPCSADDLDELRQAVQAYPQVTVRDLTQPVSTEMDSGAAGTRALVVNFEELEP